jgi:uncharacterized protein involved in exopolysaccharide biosynthesis
MSENKGLGFLDYLVIIIKWKRFLLLFAILTAVVSYLGVYFFVPVEYKADATIIPNEDNSLGGITSLVKSFSGVSSSLGAVKKTTDMDMYNTIIYSRTFIEGLTEKFGLVRLYKFQNRDRALKGVKKLISATTTMDNAYSIEVSAPTPKLAADMANYIVDELNKKVIKLNVAKSKDNREFLEKRYIEIKSNLAKSEDSLKVFQEHSRVFEVEDQTKATIEAYAKFESEIASKQVELSVMEKIYGSDSPHVSNARYALNELQNKISSIKHGNDKNSLLIPLNSLPANAIQYLRYYRNIKANSAMLEYIMPLYEQSRFDEQKDAPVLRIIDRAVPPIEKSFPSRALFTIIITLAAVFFTISIIIGREYLLRSTNLKVIFIRQNLLNFRRVPDSSKV